MAEKVIIKHDIVVTISEPQVIPGMLDRYAREGKEVISVQCLGANPDAGVPVKFMIALRWTEAG